MSASCPYSKRKSLEFPHKEAIVHTNVRFRKVTGGLLCMCPLVTGTHGKADSQWRAHGCQVLLSIIAAVWRHCYYEIVLVALT